MFLQKEAESVSTRLRRAIFGLDTMAPMAHCWRRAIVPKEFLLGNLAHMKTPAPWDHRRFRSTGVLCGPRGRRFLMGKVPMYRGTSLIRNFDPPRTTMGP